MNEPDVVFKVFETLQLTLLIVIPVGILAGVIFYFQNKARREENSELDKIASLKDEMEKLAEEKKTQRIEQPEVENKPQLDNDEIRREIESKRKDFDEFELTTPLSDLTDEEDIGNEGESHER